MVLVYTSFLVMPVSMMASGVVVAVAVDDVGMEAVLIGVVLDGPHVTAGFLQGVFSYYLVSVAVLLLSVVITSLMVSHTISEFVLRMCLESKYIFQISYAFLCYVKVGVKISPIHYSNKY